MKRMLLVLVVVAASSLFAQTSKPSETEKEVTAPALTSEEQLKIRVLEIDQMRALDAQKAAVEQLPQTKAVETATKELQEAVRAVFDKHKIDTAKLAFCDGPTPQEPLCKDVKPGELAFRVRPKQEAKK